MDANWMILVICTFEIVSSHEKSSDIADLGDSEGQSKDVNCNTETLYMDDKGHLTRFQTYYRRNDRRSNIEIYKTYCEGVNEYNIGKSISKVPSYSNKICYSNGSIETLRKGTFVNGERFSEISFEGVTINKIENSAFYGLKQLQVLNLKGTLIKSIPPGIFSGLLSLNELILSDNMIGDTLDGRNFLGLSYLTKLDLRNNSISNLEPSTLKDQLGLTHIFLENNYITKLESQVFQFSNVLQEVTLFNNNLSEIEDNVFLAAPVRLDLANNSLTELRIEIFGNFSNLSTLKYLNISNNNLKKLDKAFFNNLRILNAGFNEIVGFNHLQSYYLESLFLNNNNISGKITAGTFSETENLKELRLDGNKIRDFEFGSFTGLEKLTTLNISYNSLTKLNPKVFLPLKSLKILYIGGNNLKSLNILTVKKNLPMLNEIELNHNLWDCDGLSDMITMLTLTGVKLMHNSAKVIKSSNVHGITCYVNITAESDTNKNLNETISDFVKDHIKKIVDHHISPLNSNITEIINGHVKVNLQPFLNTSIIQQTTTFATEVSTSDEKEETEEVSTDAYVNTLKEESIASRTPLADTVLKNNIFSDRLDNILNQTSQLSSAFSVLKDFLKKFETANNKLNSNDMRDVDARIYKNMLKEMLNNQSIQSHYKSDNPADKVDAIEIKSSHLIIIILLCVLLVNVFYDFYKKYIQGKIKKYQSNRITEENEMNF